MKHVTPHTLRDHHDTCACAGACITVDVRSREEHAQGRIPGATCIPLDELMSRVDELKGKETIYVHCRSGGRSAIAAQFLSMKGVAPAVCNVEGGLMAWESAGLPVEK